MALNVEMRPSVIWWFLKRCTCRVLDHRDKNVYKIKQCWRQCWSKPQIPGLVHHISVLSCPFLSKSNYPTLPPVCMNLTYVFPSKCSSEVVRSLTCECTVLWSVCDSPQPTYAQPFWRRKKNKEISDTEVLKNRNHDDKVLYWISNHHISYPAVSIVSPPNMPTNWVLQLCSLGIGPGKTWRHSG